MLPSGEMNRSLSHFTRANIRYSPVSFLCSNLIFKAGESAGFDDAALKGLAKDVQSNINSKIRRTEQALKSHVTMDGSQTRMQGAHFNKQRVQEHAETMTEFTKVDRKQDHIQEKQDEIQEGQKQHDQKLDLVLNQQQQQIDMLRQQREEDQARHEAQMKANEEQNKLVQSAILVLSQGRHVSRRIVEGELALWSESKQLFGQGASDTENPPAVVVGDDATASVASGMTSATPTSQRRSIRLRQQRSLWSDSPASREGDSEQENKRLKLEVKDKSEQLRALRRPKRDFMSEVPEQVAVHPREKSAMNEQYDRLEKARMKQATEKASNPFA